MEAAPFGSILVWGAPGSGKTLFGWNSPYKPVLYFDFERSSLPYRRLAEKYEVKVVDIADLKQFLDYVGKIPANKYKTVMFDTGWQPFDWLSNHIFEKAGPKAEKQSQLVWADVRKAIREIMLDVMGKCEMFILTAHTRKYMDRQEEPRISPTPFELVDVAIQLVRRPNEQLPCGIVGTRNRLMGLLPPKITPCTWEKILEYTVNPPDWNNLKPEEIAEDKIYVPIGDSLEMA